MIKHRITDISKQIYFALHNIWHSESKQISKLRDDQNVVVLNLHRVSPVESFYWPPLKPDIFDDLLRFLKTNFEVVSFQELADVKSKKPLAVLSFDDGYYDFIEYVAPLLEKHNLRANMNIIPQCVETGVPIWNVRLYDFLDHAPKSLIDQIRLPGFEHRLKDESRGSKVRYGLAISRILKRRSRTERDEMWKMIEGLIARLDFPSTRMMNFDEIMSINTVHEVGVHSFSHESMEYEDTEFFENDLMACKDYFEKKLRKPLEIYAFPNGSYRQEQVDILKSNGIKRVLLVGEDYAKRDETVMPRFTIYGSTKLETRCQALGFNRKK